MPSVSMVCVRTVCQRRFCRANKGRCLGAVDHHGNTRVGAKLPRPHGQRSHPAAGNRLSPRRNRGWQKEHRVHRAQLAKERDRVGPARAKIKQRPAATRDPVNPTALISGCCTSASPTSRRPPWTSEKLPAAPQCRIAASIACAIISPVPGCAEWPFTTTGQPAASAEAVSPPATEKAQREV